MMYEELVKRLRETPIDMRCAKVMREAADAIEELQKDLERSKEYETFWEKEANEALKKFSHHPAKAVFVREETE